MATAHAALRCLLCVGTAILRKYIKRAVLGCRLPSGIKPPVYRHWCAFVPAVLSTVGSFVLATTVSSSRSGGGFQTVSAESPYRMGVYNIFLVPCVGIYLQARSYWRLSLVGWESLSYSCFCFWRTELRGVVEGNHTAHLRILSRDLHEQM